MHRIISGRRVLAGLTLAMAMLMTGCGSSPEAGPNAPASTVDAGTTAPTGPASKVDSGTTAPSPQPLLYFSGTGAEVAIYADGRVIWPIGDGDPGYLVMRLTPEAVERLRSRAVSTGLFQQDQRLTLDHRPGGMEVGRGSMEIRRGDRSVVVVWREDPSTNRSWVLVRDLERTSAATAEQEKEVIELVAFFRDPTAWRLSSSWYVQPEISPFVPSRISVVFDGGEPDWSTLRSPAREIIGSSRLEGLSRRDGCRVISADQAREIARALTQAGIEADYDSQRGSLGFSAAGSFVHSFPALPHEVGC